ncbi:MAG: fructose-bisphosphatase class III [Oscillospiraceae bacterium]|nr:fructose-bisphosphatase class III [Oscillospiraceae bacterium]
MTYVMSDLHGEYRKYIQMLETINFSDEDTLFVLGDIVDRGDEPVRLLKDLMGRHNVFVTMGNHDYFACDVLSQLMEEITDDTTALAPELMNQVLDWVQDGGLNTMLQFRELSGEERNDIISFISSLPMVEIAEINDRCFVMSHAGLGNFQKGKKLRDYSVFELIGARPEPDIRCFDDETVFVVCGHTPTVNICGENRIYQKNGNIYIDCGAVFGGKLGCLCLDTMEEFYV